MDEHPQPEPDPPQDEAGLPDREWDEYVAWREREIAAGRVEEAPAPWELEGPAVSLSLGDAADVDPALLAAICGPDGLGGDGLGAQFGQDAAADALRPGPVLASLTEQAAADLPRLTDDQLIGTLQAARRLENRAYYLQTRAIAEFAQRRTEEVEAEQARGVPVGCWAGDFPGAELACELLVSRVAAGQRIDAATSLATRLPRTLQGMSAGLIDAERAEIIAAYTACLGPQAASVADEVLAAAAPEVRTQTLARRAAALAMKLDPDAVRSYKERRKRIAQRVEARPERSGNASVAGRELDTADALASMAHIRALALRLRRGGLAGSLDRLRTMVFNDLLQGRDPSDRLAPIPEAPAEIPEAPADDIPEPATDRAPEPPAAARDQVPPGEHVPAGEQVPLGDWDPRDAPVPEYPADVPDFPDDPDADDPDAEELYADNPDPDDPDRDDDYGYGDVGTACPDPASAGTAARTPMPAAINLLVSAGTLFGWDTTPTEAGGWGLLDPDETRDIVQAASRHPRTRWSITLLCPDGTAVAHGRAAGRHPWTAAVPPAPAASDQPPPGVQPPPPAPSPPRPDGPTPEQAARFAELLRGLNITLEPIARGTCDHRHAEDRYTPSRKLQGLVRARNATCTAPGCTAQAALADLDHTVPYPDGPTDEHNLGPVCRSDHRAKQAPGWKVEQPEPGVFRWTLPSGRSHVTRPTVY